MTWEWRDSGPLKPGLPGILTRDPQRLCEMLGVNRKERRKQWSEAKSDENALGTHLDNQPAGCSADRR